MSSRNDKIIGKIDLLGGVSPNPSCLHHDTSSRDVSELESLLNIKLPDCFALFYQKYGPCAFKQTVKVNIPQGIGKSGNSFVNYFYEMSIDGKCSVLDVINMYEGRLPYGYLPVCDGDPGDLVCINLNEKNFGSIHYWWHEGKIGENVIKISDDFHQFVLSLFNDTESISDDELKDIKVKTTPALIELLRKSGYGPKKE